MRLTCPTLPEGSHSSGQVALCGGKRQPDRLATTGAEQLERGSPASSAYRTATGQR